MRSSKGAPADLHEGQVRFHLFDLPDSTEPYKVRRQRLQPLSAYAQVLGLNTKVGSSFVAQCEADVDSAYEYFRSQGHEGAMVKQPEALYAIGKRTDAWLKLKPEETVDGRIVAVHQAHSIEGVPLDRAGSVTVKMEDGSLADPHGIAHELGRQMLADPQRFIGEWVEVRYMERDRQGGYRHPTLVRFREAKV